MKIEELPWGLCLAQKAFRKRNNRKKVVVAVYIEGNSILIESNCKKTDPGAKRLGHRFFFRHAEYNVLKKVEDASQGVLYIYRETMEGNFGMARPCDCCIKFLREKNIRKIVYSTNNGWAKERLIY